MSFLPLTQSQTKLALISVASDEVPKASPKKRGWKSFFLKKKENTDKKSKEVKPKKNKNIKKEKEEFPFSKRILNFYKSANRAPVFDCEEVRHQIECIMKSYKIFRRQRKRARQQIIDHWIRGNHLPKRYDYRIIKDKIIKYVSSFELDYEGDFSPRPTVAAEEALFGIMEGIIENNNYLRHLYNDKKKLRKYEFNRNNNNGKGVNYSKITKKEEEEGERILSYKEEEFDIKGKIRKKKVKIHLMYSYEKSENIYSRLNPSSNTIYITEFYRNEITNGDQKIDIMGESFKYFRPGDSPDKEWPSYKTETYVMSYYDKGRPYFVVGITRGTRRNFEKRFCYVTYRLLRNSFLSLSEQLKLISRDSRYPEIPILRHHHSLLAMENWND